ncbi:hypothetical protein TI05_19050 [Achromatium sp. WMS3]|nr:hypothetical protein TI05_19050 [Achromatium sp. WMS3]
MQKLSNPDCAIINIDKLSGYCLNSEHPDGRHKAKVFMSALNLGKDDAEILKSALLKAIKENEAIPSKSNEYGQKYIIDFEMTHLRKIARIRGAWIMRNNENFPRLITCYII